MNRLEEYFIASGNLLKPVGKEKDGREIKKTDKEEDKDRKMTNEDNSSQQEGILCIILFRGKKTKKVYHLEV